ncbi:sporulation initiation phosphotransferase F [Desulfosporosinus acididurans]|uniref:Stage 0 sporulation protein A homolog n=1 Tax=Desulfosporosinus acididurans TaxID=476652 RepID=A0A0J1FS86_9FIRM|nr:response regulator [Desulfosporosinus acididurans]KLU66360.1 sporulation initiation phosphotransferase F [Desulfosporosinus acididurans]
MSQGSLLIVDDNLGIRSLLNALFSSKGYTVLTATSGIEALSLAKAQLPDLIISDIKMPGLNGLELREQLHRYNPNIRVILMSAYTDQQEINEILRNGAIDYVMTKPFDLEELSIAVDTLLLNDQHQ